MKPKNSCLLATHHLRAWGGSELVVIELAEALSQLGFEVDLFTPFYDEAFVEEAFNSLLTIHTDPKAICLHQYDFVYTQHQTLNSILNVAPKNSLFEPSMPVLVYNHLSPYEPFEFPGPFVESLAADIILANSCETQNKIKTCLNKERSTSLFPNPAPRDFEQSPRPPEAKMPKALLAVSNHLPKEMGLALELLEDRGVAVTRLGRPGNCRRVQAEDIAAHDAVITIGKTVQYALRARRAVFCYDHFGGPGWLADTAALRAAEFYNFSGRCTPNKLDSAELADVIISGFSKAANFSSNLLDEDIRPYQLEFQLRDLLALVGSKYGRSRLSKTPAGQQADFICKLSHEAEIYGLIDRHYEKMTNLTDQRTRLAQNLQRQKNRSEHLQKKLDQKQNSGTA